MKNTLVLLFLFCSVCVFGQTYSDTALQNSSGNYARIVPFAPVTVCASSDVAVPCTNKVSTYTTQALATPCTLTGGNGGATSGIGCNNPGLADANGNYTVFIAAGTYRICVYAQNYSCLLKTVASGTSGGGIPAGLSTQLQANILGAFGAITNVIPGSLLASQGASTLPIFQPKPVVDARDPISGFSSGVKCDGSTDDYAASQGLFNYYGLGGPGAGQTQQIQFPAGTCKISNMLAFEGNNSLGVRITGQTGWGGGISATNFAWFGPNAGTMMLMLGCNNCSVENIDFALSPSGGGKAQNGLWWDASNTVTPATYNISAITRSGSVVTVTTTAVHAVTAGRIARVSGSTGGTTSFNGSFQVLYSNDSTHFSWIQGGANESGTVLNGTVTNYQSAPANNLEMLRVKVSGPKAISSTVSAIHGTGASTALTTTAAHFINLGDTIIVRGVTDATYNCAWLVTAVPTSTTATLVALFGTQCSPDNASSSGGTVLTGSSGIRFGHLDLLTEQVSQIKAEDIFIQGDQLGGSVNCLETDNAGNVKNFEFVNVIANGCRYGFNGFNSGNFNVWGYNGGLTTPDSSLQLASIDFVNNSGQIAIIGAEVEGFNDRFFINTGVTGNTAHLDGISFQSGGPTDDIVVGFGGTMYITGSSLFNRRAAGAVPYVACLSGNPLFTGNTTNAGCSLVSHGNFYANSLSGGSSLGPGFIPFKDGSGNGFMQPGGLLGNKGVNVESIGDQSSITSDNTQPVGPLTNVAAFGAIVSSTCGGNNGVAASGFGRLCDTDVINARNHANNADVNLISKTTSDLVVLGGAAGISASAYATSTNCAVNSVSPAACGSAPSGAVVIPTATATYTVNTSIVTAASRILLFPMSFAGNLPSAPTCVAPAVTSAPTISAISAGVSFTITLPSTTGQTCWQYSVVN